MGEGQRSDLEVGDRHMCRQKPDKSLLCRWDRGKLLGRTGLGTGQPRPHSWRHAYHRLLGGVHRICRSRTVVRCAHDPQRRGAVLEILNGHLQARVCRQSSWSQSQHCIE